MVNDILLPPPTINMNEETPTAGDYQSLILENEPAIPISQNQDLASSISYMPLSVGDNQRFNLSSFQDPLFCQQPLHFHYHKSLPSTAELGHEKGDRVRLTTEYRKQKSISAHKHTVNKSKSTHRSYVNSMKSKENMKKSKEKKAAAGSVKKLKHKNKRINRSDIRHQVNNTIV